MPYSMSAIATSTGALCQKKKEFKIIMSVGKGRHSTLMIQALEVISPPSEASNAVNGNAGGLVGPLGVEGLGQDREPAADHVRRRAVAVRVVHLL